MIEKAILEQELVKVMKYIGFSIKPYVVVENTTIEHEFDNDIVYELRVGIENGFCQHIELETPHNASMEFIRGMFYQAMATCGE